MINSQINILSQAKTYLESINPALYTQVVTPLFMSSPGAHLRHILDHYIAIINGQKVGVIDYDKRNRGGVIETDINAALGLISEIEVFLLSLTKVQLLQPLQLSTEVCVQKKQVEIITTTLVRELIFVGSHAIHHFAMIEQISKAQKSPSPIQFGIAPASATFLRDKISKNECAH